MDSLNLFGLRSYLPKSLPRLPSWPQVPSDDDEPGPSSSANTSSTPEPVFDEKHASMSLADPSPIPAGPKSYLDLINECDNFPYYHTNPKLYLSHVNTYYALHVAKYPDVELGYLLPSVVEAFRGLPDWSINDTDRTLTLLAGETEAERSQAIALTTQVMRETGFFQVLKGWRNELYPVYGPTRELLFSIERAASALFGVVTYGCHMTAYTKSEDRGLRIWVPRRAVTKQTYGGMLDNTVAGGIATGESVLESMIRESAEEASLPEEMVREKAKAVGTVTYFHVRDRRAGGETGLLQPECQYVYDLELGEDVVPKPSDDEVESFELKSVEEVKKDLRDGSFKPNCAVVLLDFFVRHGIITAEDEDYVELVARLHRRLEFPTQ
ncbi:hypothetical protein B0A48_04929 [Cryoendolithus antarcticus]|uniref:Nudix hydrolase domain-containing protein n=1 Tax=Cryoendolithus antarcticus TaxID=1507870 RepID=A0A1V8TDQ3_9PEZI|nr:hypothetical protein B0A48_04929 [Cryoendolithus antarcticus]